jgi:peptidyl-prolyl cis-trans isomerase A (cyclophilin A)
LLTVLALSVALGCTACETSSSSGNESSAVANSNESSGDATPHPALRDPSKLEAKQAPETFRVRFETTEGPFVVTFHRDWSPHGADRVYNLVRIGYYEDVAFFRVVEGFMAQFGYHGDPDVIEAWKDETIPDDPVKKSNTRGYVSFAKRKKPDTRSTQMFVNYADNSKLDQMKFAPVGKVTEGMKAVDALHAGYGDGPPRGNGPSQAKIQKRGNAYLEEKFPKLDYIETAEIVEPSDSEKK